MDCEQAREEFSALLDGELSPEGRAAVEVHLAECADCLRELEGYRRVSALYGEMARVPAPSDFEERVRERLHSKATRFGGASRRRYIAPFLAAAAVLLLVIGGAFELLQMEAPTRQTASVNMPERAVQKEPMAQMTDRAELQDQLQVLGYLDESEPSTAHDEVQSYDNAAPSDAPAASGVAGRRDRETSASESADSASRGGKVNGAGGYGGGGQMGGRFGAGRVPEAPRGADARGIADSKLAGAGQFGDVIAEHVSEAPETAPEANVPQRLPAISSTPPAPAPPVIAKSPEPETEISEGDQGAVRQVDSLPTVNQAEQDADVQLDLGPQHIANRKDKDQPVRLNIAAAEPASPPSTRLFTDANSDGNFNGIMPESVAPADDFFAAPQSEAAETGGSDHTQRAKTGELAKAVPELEHLQTEAAPPVNKPLDESQRLEQKEEVTPLARPPRPAGEMAVVTETRTLRYRDGLWVENGYRDQALTSVQRGSVEWQRLVAEDKTLSGYADLKAAVIFRLGTTWYRLEAPASKE